MSFWNKIINMIPSYSISFLGIRILDLFKFIGWRRILPEHALGWEINFWIFFFFIQVYPIILKISSEGSIKELWKDHWEDHSQNYLIRWNRLVLVKRKLPINVLCTCTLEWTVKRSFLWIEHWNLFSMIGNCAPTHS